MATAQEMKRKITISEVAGKSAKWFKQLVALDTKAPGTVLPLCKIYGMAVGFKPDMSANGEFVKFFGNFRGVDIRPDAETGEPSGEVVNSGTVILPNFLNGPLMAALSGDNPRLQFGLEIGVRYDDTAATKYTFVVKDSVAPKPENDPLLQLEVDMGIKPASALRLAAPPAEAPSPAPAPAPAPAKQTANGSKRR